MQLSTRFRWLAALVLWLGPLLAAHATHILGGELTYTPIASTTAGVPRYHLMARLYRQTSGVTAASSQTLVCSRGGCAASAAGGFTLALPRTQSSATYSLGCPTSPMYAYEANLYEVDVNLPAGQWTLSVSDYNRAAGIVNLLNSVNKGYYLSAYLDNSAVGQNASPKFLSLLLPYLCNNQAQRYSFSAFDVEGDSLVYQFVQPEESVANSGCGTMIPGTLSPHFLLNAATGALTSVPNAPTQLGAYGMAARVSEYRRVNNRWLQIGYVTRDVTYLVVVGSTNQTPVFTNLQLNGAAATQPLGQTIRVQPGQTVALGLTASDPDVGQVLRFESQAPDVIPGLRLQTTGATSAQLTWQVPATLPPGRYTATVAVLDNGCPNASEEYTFSFLVAAQPLAVRAGQRAEAEAFPTPFRDQVQFQTSVGSQAITVIDGVGRVVARLTAAADGRVLWQPAPTLPAGLYVARSADGRSLARLLRAE